MPPADLPRSTVPGVIAVVRDFVNTTDHETGSDDLASPAQLTRHLLAEGLLGRASRATPEDLDLALRLRSGLRAALELNHDGTSAALPVLSAALAELPIALDWSAGGARLRPATPGVRGALARIGLAAQQAAVEGIWWRLKICAFDECAWAYYDQSKNRSRNWCEYGCGNKVKTRAYRARRAARGPHADSVRGAPVA